MMAVEGDTDLKMTEMHRKLRGACSLVISTNLSNNLHFLAHEERTENVTVW